MNTYTTFKPHTLYHATYTGPGEFYSGIHTGERVTVDTRGNAQWWVSIQSLEHPGAWLTVDNIHYDRLTDITEATN
jgi:hypothetical protein